MKQKLKALIWPIIYLVLILNVCLSFVLVFRSYYFKSIFVSGTSMQPTLNGHEDGRVDYGIIDDHKTALSNLKRFQIVTTYYPFENDYVGGYDPAKGKDNVIDTDQSSYKIKRVYGFPGETIKFTYDEAEIERIKTIPGYETSFEAQYLAAEAIHFFVKGPKDEEFVEQPLKFKRKLNINRAHEYDYEYELGKEEYWVMGDNYSHSQDCHSKQKPIYKDNLVGVLIAIEGTCTIPSKYRTEDSDGTKRSYTCVNRKRHAPVFY